MTNYLNGVDVSSWQSGINLEILPGDFVVCKATEGTSFVSSDFVRQANQTLASGKLLGIYHYINGAGATAEAQHFYNHIKPYLGKTLVVLDWEAGGNNAWGNLNYLDSFIKQTKKLTGITPMIYASSSVFPWQVASANGCSTWVAQYASNNPTGYQANPWNENAYTCDMRQYSSSGRLNGWNGNLDINKFYGDRTRWQKLAGQTIQPTKEWDEMASKEEIKEIVEAAIRGTVLTAPKDSGIGNMSLGTAVMWTNSDTTKIKTSAANAEASAKRAESVLCDPITSGLDGSTGDFRTRLKYMDYNIKKILTQNAALEAALKALADSKGVSGDEIAQIVTDAVKAKLETISLEVTVD